MRFEFHASLCYFSYMQSKSTCSLGTIYINSFTCYGNIVKTKNASPVSFSIQHNSKNEQYFIDEPELGIFSLSYKKEGLTRELKQSLEYVWAAIALEKNERLSAENIKVKKNLLKVFKEQVS
jgi:hypothetical protein